MERGEKIGVAGIVFAGIPLIILLFANEEMAPIFTVLRPFLNPIILVFAITGLILSLISISINRAKTGIIGLLISITWIVIAIIDIMIPWNIFFPSDPEIYLL